MRWYLAPGLAFAVIVTACMAMGGAVIWLATAQPWLGVEFEARETALIVVGVDAGGPVPPALKGAQILSVAQQGQPPLLLDASDLVEEPDMLGDGAQIAAFYAKQQQIYQILAAGNVTLTYSDGAGGKSVGVIPGLRRPLADLPIMLWGQVFVGLTGVLIGAWVTVLRRGEFAAWMLLLAGLGLGLASGSAALYSAREIALPYTVFSAASRINSLGTFVFGIGMVTLFLVYPRKFASGWLLALPGLLIAGLIGVICFVEWPRFVPLLQDGVAVVMLVLLAAIGLQVVINRRDPVARAMLGWLGLSIGLGAGGFVLTVIVPVMLGQAPLLPQSTAFLLFLIVYIGIAVGVARYRLFDLARWSFGILSYGVGVALLLLLDAALIYGLSLDRAPAFGVALAVVGIVYLPLRGRFAQWLRREKHMPPEELYRRVTEIAHAVEPQAKLALLRAFWTDVFTPLSISDLRGKQPETRLQENGAVLILSPVHRMPALRLEWAGRGARLFSSADLARARRVSGLIDQTLKESQTYLEAITAERSRINRDMHDNIGLLLLGALHADGVNRKDLLIRQTLTDLREIISNPDLSNWQLSVLIADLRAEISSHLEAADIKVDWHTAVLGDRSVAPVLVHTLRSFLREGISNIVRHAKAKTVWIKIGEDAGTMTVSLADDGAGFDAQTVRQGNGFGNLANRVAQMGGAFDVSSTAAGTTLFARMPMAPNEKGDEL